MKPSRVFLGAFVILTIAFAFISAFEFVQLGNGRIQSNQTTTTTTTVTTTIITQTSLSSTVGFPDNGYIQIGSVGYFAYTRIATSSGVPTTSTQTFQSVTFAYVKPNATITGGVCDVFKVTFQVDGSSENLTACSYPTNLETVVVFSKHANPTAGLMFVASNGSVYLLVSI